jgi:hypothetical protein
MWKKGLSFSAFYVLVRTAAFSSCRSGASQNPGNFGCELGPGFRRDDAPMLASRFRRQNVSMLGPCEKYVNIEPENAITDNDQERSADEYPVFRIDDVCELRAFGG